MDWPLAITRNQHALKRIVATLFAMFSAAVLTSEGPSRRSLGEGGRGPLLPRQIYAAIMLILRPAESALRRLIVIASWDMVVKPRAARSITAVFPTVSNASRAPIFGLFDSLKHFTFEDYDINVIPNASFDASDEPNFQPPQSSEPVNATQLFTRLRALRSALNDIQSQARRLARYNAKIARNRPTQPRNTPFKPVRQSPIRPGLAPGWRQRPIHDVDDVLKECHLLAQDLMNATDSG